jgi:hypothetical protein
MHQQFEQFHNRLYRAVTASPLGGTQFVQYQHGGCANILEFLDTVMYQHYPVAYILKDFSLGKIIDMQAYLTHGFKRPTPEALQPISTALMYFYSVCSKLGINELTTDVPAQFHKSLEDPTTFVVFKTLSEELYIPHREVLLVADNLVSDFGACFAPEPDEGEEPVNTEFLNDR